MIAFKENATKCKLRGNWRLSGKKTLGRGMIKFCGTVDMFPISTMVISSECIYNVKTIVHLKYIFLLYAN